MTEMGRSFKGSAAYYLHDKPAPDGSFATTSNRVGWTEILNLPTTDPERAWRMMAHTALAQGVLKTVAGVKRTGRRLAKPVLAYSLSWHPDERPTRAEQLDAAKESLKALGLEEHQVIIACHTDEPHPHVHVLVNRVHPMTGKAAPLSKSKLALSAWAQSYEERHGRVFCHARVENNARRGGTRPGRASDNRTRRVSRAAWEAGRPASPESAALRRQHAELFSLQAAREVQGARQRTAEAQAFHAARKAGRRASTDREIARAKLAAHPAAAEAAARVTGLLASDRPAAALASLTRDRSTFTRAELERFVARHTKDPASFTAALAALDASGGLICVGRDAKGRDRLTTPAHQTLEWRMIETAGRLSVARRKAGGVPARFKGWSLSADQSAALLHVLALPRLACVSGVAGTGKSTMLNAARQSWEAAGFRVQGMALAAEAAEGLKTGSGILSGTIHSRLYQWEQGRNLPGPKDVLVVDEAGMIGSRQMERLLHFAEASGAKIVLVGDAHQLQAIEAGGAFRAIAERFGAARIKTVRRQKATWQKDATNELATGRTGEALARYEAAGMVHGHKTDADAKAAVIAAWNRHRVAHPGQTQLVMAFLRRDVAELNARARACLHAAGALGADVTLDTAQGRQSFAIHDRVYFLRNEARMNVRNGSLGTIEAIHGRTVIVRLDGAAPRHVTLDLDAYGHITHGYAATIHKSQGATVDRAHLYCSPNLDQHAAYVAMTRHRDRLDVHWSEESILTRKRLTAILSRLALKDTSFDYAGDAAADRQARSDAGDDMRGRILARAQAFAEREATPAGRLANARALSSAGASLLQIARLAHDAPARVRLFRHRQSVLRRWIRRLAALPLPTAAVAQCPAPAARLDALRSHDRETIRMMQEMQARHAAQREGERAGRLELQRQAAIAWLAIASQATATAFLRRWTGYATAHWRAHQAGNDNRPAPTPTPPLPGPV